MVRRILLDLIYALAAVLAAPLWMRKKRDGWRERFGHAGDGEAEAISVEQGRGRRLLIHAVSVGEVNLTLPLVQQLLAEPDRWCITVSVGTDTGIARARTLFAHMSGVRVVRYPLDASWAVRRFLDRVRPDAVVLVELELWPNFLDACRRRGIPVGVVNGRLSERSFRGYRRLRLLLKRYFRGLAFAAVQDEVYAERFEAMGARKNLLHVAGSMKWDSADLGVPESAAVELAEAMGIDRGRPLIVGGSTAPGEHELLVEAAAASGAQLLCAPRRPEWFDEATRVLGEGTVRRSQPGAGNASKGRFVLDTIGELRAAYALADVVVVGRSFGDLAGSDPMEPAAPGKPVLIGPAHGDFLDAVRVLRGSGGLRVVEREELATTIGALLADEGERGRVASAAAGCVRSMAGATARHVELIERYMGEERSGA